MGKKKQRASGQVEASPRIHVPKDALSRVNLGDAFAQQDKVLQKPNVFVETPAMKYALDSQWSKFFFVGRRGTGKTALTYYIQQKLRRAFVLTPQVLVPDCLSADPGKFSEMRQKPFKTLVHFYRRLLATEVLREWMLKKLTVTHNLPNELSRERNLAESFDFDLRLLHLSEEYLANLDSPDERSWVKLTKRDNTVLTAMDAHGESRDGDHVLLIDNLDESFDEGRASIIAILALMHACVEIGSKYRSVRPLLFLRENVFELAKKADSEFSRLETHVVSMDWTQELLLELIERRLNAALPTKLPLKGPTWDHFFESTDGQSSREFVFNYCQHRPRDVLIFCKYAVESAQSHRRNTVSPVDLIQARGLFSLSRYGDLCEEYSDNYPQVKQVIDRFFGLTTKYTVYGLETIVTKLLLDESVKKLCKSWIYTVATPEHFALVLYNIGFLGIGSESAATYRPPGVLSSSPPVVETSTIFTVHPSYWPALQLQDAVLNQMDDAKPLRTSGIAEELPDAVSLVDYASRLDKLTGQLQALPKGRPSYTEFEDIVGEVIRLCFFRSLNDVSPKVRTSDGTQIRDWIAANVASTGFWATVKQKYGASQVIWECKNYEELAASDFHQMNYYLGSATGRFGILVFRGDVTDHYFEHVRQVHTKTGGLVLLLTERDLLTFIRQARNYKVKESHIVEIFNRFERSI